MSALAGLAASSGQGLLGAVVDILSKYQHSECVAARSGRERGWISERDPIRDLRRWCVDGVS